MTGSNGISLGHFNFLCFIGCPYEGTIKNVGKAYCQPIIVPSRTPEDQSISHGTFLSTQYVSVVGPATTSDTNYLTERIMEELVTRHPDGSVEVWDVNSKKYYKFDNTTEIKVDYIADQIRIEVKDKSGNNYKHENHLEVFLQDLNNRTPSSISWSKLLVDGLGSAIAVNTYKYQNLKTGEKSRRVYNSKKFVKKLGVQIKTRNANFYREIIPKVQKIAGRLMFVVSSGFVIGDAFSSGGIKVSHVLDITLLGLSIATGGWVIGLGYFLTDIFIIFYTYYTTGHARSIGDFINDWTEKELNIENGVLWQFR